MVEIIYYQMRFYAQDNNLSLKISQDRHTLAETESGERECRKFNMTAIGACIFAAGFSPAVVRSCLTPSSGKKKSNPTRRFAVSTEQILTKKAETTTTSFPENERLKMKRSENGKQEKQNPVIWELAEAEKKIRKSLKDYFEESKDFIRSDGGPPRWFSPLECGSRLDESPLLLYLPGKSFLFIYFHSSSSFSCSVHSLISLFFHLKILSDIMILNANFDWNLRKVGYQ